MTQQSYNLVRHLVDVPKINLEGVVENLRHAGLLADDHGNIVHHRFQRRYAKGFRYAGHDIDVSHLEDSIYVLAPQEAGEKQFVTDTHFCRELDGWNTFQTIVEKHEPAIREVREHLASAGAVCALMSGSGSAVFGVFERPEDARRAAGSVGKGVVARTVTTA